jgi:hypothetical protein
MIAKFCAYLELITNLHRLKEQNIAQPYEIKIIPS